MASGLDAVPSALAPHQSSVIDIGTALSGGGVSTSLAGSGSSALLSRSSVVDAHLNSNSCARHNSRSDRVLRLRRSYALSRDSHHAGLMEGQSLSQLRHSGGYGRKHPLSRSLPSLGHVGNRRDRGRRLRRPRAGLRPAPRQELSAICYFTANTALYLQST